MASELSLRESSPESRRGIRSSRDGDMTMLDCPIRVKAEQEIQPKYEWKESFVTSILLHP